MNYSSKTVHWLWLQKYEKLLICATTLLFFSVGFFLISHHEIWRDEAQPWVLARDSKTFLEHFHQLRYATSPMLWHSILFVLTRFTSNPFFGNILNLVIATSAAFVFLRFSPFPLILRVLFVLGYFPLYEYGIIQRPYALGMLLWFLLSVVYQKRFQRFDWVCLILILFANVIGHTMVIAFAVSLMLLVEYLARQKSLNSILPPRKAFLNFAMLILSLLLSALFLTDKPEDFYFPAGGKTSFDLRHVFRSVVRPIFMSFVPIPPWTMTFWNQSFLPNNAFVSLLICMLLSLMLIPYLIYLRRKPYLFFTYGLCVCTLGLFAYTIHTGYLRHWGMYYLVFVGVMWWDSEETTKSSEFLSLDTFEKFFDRLKVPLLSVLFSIHAVAAAIAGIQEVRYSFSGSKQVVEYIRKHPEYHNAIFVAEMDLAMTPILAYVDNKFFYPRGQRFGTYTIWDRWRRSDVPLEDLIWFSVNLEKDYGVPTLILLNSDPSRVDWFRERTEKVAEFVESVVSNEKYFLFKVRRDLPIP